MREIEGVPTELANTNGNGIKGAADPTSISSRLDRPVVAKETPETPLGRKLFDRNWRISHPIVSPNPPSFPRIPHGDERTHS